MTHDDGALRAQDKTVARTGKTALVTGASAGLGVEFARLFAEDGHDVVLVARRRENLEALARKLETTYGVRAIAIAEDLMRPEEPGRIAEELRGHGLAVDFLVNNAGFATRGRFAEADLARELGMLALNVTALVHLTRLLLPAMIERGAGRILNMGSTAGFMPGPFMAGYYASKAFVISFTEALAFELRGTGVTATVSCPGPTATEFASVAGAEKSRLFEAGTMGAGEVAAHAFRVMMQGRTVAIPGAKNKLSMMSLRFAPRAMAISMAASLNQTSDGRAVAADKTR
jgi:short-subunit dehydrogenase